MQRPYEQFGVGKIRAQIEQYWMMWLHTVVAEWDQVIAEALC